jgi:hypothetical protein
MDRNSDRDADDADPDNHPSVMALKRTLNVFCGALLVGEVFG